MTADALILSIDQGTTSSRALVFDTDLAVVAAAQHGFPQHYPDSGWVEHDPADIWETTLAACREAIAAAPGPITGIGIANQRETTLVWDRRDGAPVYNAIVWQDRRTADHCRRLREAGAEEQVADRTGLVLDPYFSATKIAWILDHVPGARARAEAGELAFGTVDSWLIWQLTGGREHLTDATNASRTALFDLRKNRWDDELLELFDIPAPLLPAVRDCAGDFGRTAPGVLPDVLPLCGVAGDQQAALVGQGCLRPGMVKSTCGTGCFLMMNTGERMIRSRHRLLSTLAWRLGGTNCYALEGAIFNAGTTIQWLRDRLGILPDTAAIAGLLDELDSNEGVYLVPAFTGLGAPHWDPDARGLLTGLTRDTGPAHLVRAAIESVCHQVRDLLGAMQADSGLAPTEIRVDGGMAVNDHLLQWLADLTAVRTCRPPTVETTALGAAHLARLQLGLVESTDQVAAGWRPGAVFDPDPDDTGRAARVAGWERALARCLG